MSTGGNEDDYDDNDNDIVDIIVMAVDAEKFERILMTTQSKSSMTSFPVVQKTQNACMIQSLWYDSLIGVVNFSQILGTLSA